MISRSPATGASVPREIWSKLAAPLPPGSISWRQDGRPTQRGDAYFARFVAFIDATVVRERLDSVVPGEWDLTLEALPPVLNLDGDANQGACNFKARLQVLGVIREDVGTGKDYKQASTDAFKRAAVRFGIGAELYTYEQNWVQVNGDGKFAKPVEDPNVAYARRYGRSTPATPAKVVPDEIRESLGDNPEDTALLDPNPVTTAAVTPTPAPADDPSCPKCGGRMWDNRLTKRNPKAPDYKCRDRACDGVVWPPKTQQPSASAKPGRESVQGPLHRDEIEAALDMEPAGADDQNEIPF